MSPRTLALAILAGAAIAAPSRAQVEPINLNLSEQYANGSSLNLVLKTVGDATTLALGQQADLAATWTPSATPLTAGVFAHALVSSGNKTYPSGGQPSRRLYLIGGQRGPNLLRDVLVARMDAAGVVSGFTPATNFLPQSRAYHTAALYNNVIYVVGGDVSTTGQLVDLQVTDSVLMSVVQADGEPGPWVETTKLPQALDSVGLVASKGTLYAIGGAPPGDQLIGTTQTFSAPIKGDGTLGEWTQLTSDDAQFPARYGAGGFAIGDDLWAVGGVNFSFAEQRDVSLSDTRRATLGANGAPGPWTDQDNLPIEIGNIHTSTVLAAGKAYLLGGYRNGAAADTVLTGPMNEFGRITGWTQSTNNLPRAVYLTGATLAGNALVMAGGRDVANVERTEVIVNPLIPTETAPLSPFGTLESQVYDLGAARNIVSFGFAITPAAPAETGSAQVQIRTAGANGVFGVWSALTSTSPIAVNQSIRYLQYRVLLSTTGTGTQAPEVGGLVITPGENAVIYGDVNGDKAVNIQDAVLTLRFATNIQTPNAENIAAGDVAPKPGTNGKPFGDGLLNVQDAVRILRALVNLDTLP